MKNKRILIILFCLLIAILTLIIRIKKSAIGIVVLIAILIGVTVFTLVFASSEYDKNSIRIIRLNFTRIDRGMGELNELYPFIFTKGNYINTYIFNTYNNHYYELYKKDDIKWMRDIGITNPKERY